MKKPSKSLELELKSQLSEIQQAVNSGDYEKALELLDSLGKALDEMKITNELRVDYLAELGKLYMRKGDYQQAEKYLLQAKKEGTEYPRSSGYALNYLGLVEWSRGNLEQAEIYYFESLKLRKQAKDVIGVGTTLGNIGLLHLTRGEPKKAIEYLNESTNVLEEVGTKEAKFFLFYSVDNTGEAYRTQGKILKAEEYYLKALEIAKEIKKKDGRAWSNLRLGIVAWAKGDLQKAKNYLIISRMMWKNLDTRDYGYVETIATLAGVYTDLEEYKKAARTLDEAQIVNDEIDSDYSRLFVTYFRGYLKQRQNDTDSAKEYFENCLTKAKDQKNTEYILKSLVALSNSALSDYYSTFQKTYLEKAQKLLKTLEETAREKNLTLHLDEALIIQGMLLSVTMDYEESQKILKKAIEVAKEGKLAEQVDKAQSEFQKVKELQERAAESPKLQVKKSQIEEILNYLEKYQQTLRALTT